VFRTPLVSGLLALILMVLPGQVSAHSMPGTTLQLGIRATGVTAKLSLPLDELRLATRWPLPETGGLPESVWASESVWVTAAGLLPL
jgi:hypothetical protein